MEPPDTRIVVVRAWREAGGLRIRVLAELPEARGWVFTSVADACDLVAALLTDLLDPAADTPRGPTPTDTTD